MTFRISPGVSFREIDLTTVIPAVSSSIGAYVGQFRWGPVDEAFTVSSEDELAVRVLKPNDATRVDFLMAANFLSYSNTLKISQPVSSTALNATTASAGFLVKNDTHYEDGGLTFPASCEWIARYPGAEGNSLQVITVPNRAAYIALSGIAQANTVKAAISSTTGTFTVGETITQAVSLATGVVVAVEKTGATAGFIYYTVTSGTFTFAGAVVTGGTSGATGALGAVDLISSYTKALYSNIVNQINGKYPETSDYAESKGATNDEMHIFVIDEDGKFSGTNGTILEAYYGVSQASDGRTTDNGQNYYVDVINNQSDYIRWGQTHDAAFDSAKIGTATTNGKNYANVQTGLGMAVPLDKSLAFGTAGTTITDGELITAYDVFKNPEQIDVNLIIVGPKSETVGLHVIQNICEVRLDCVAFLSPPRELVVNNSDPTTDLIEWRQDDLSNYSSSFAMLVDNWKYVYDKYNDKYAWIPCDVDVAGLCARTDSVRDPWWSPAGFNRGNLKNVIKLAWNSTETNRDALYQAEINSIVSFPGLGTILYGDKTMLTRDSVFSQIGVRRLFIILEKSISIASKFSLFELNDQFTRAQFIALIDPFLRDVQGRRGITRYRIVCDETNNTAEVINQKSFIGDIYIVPTTSVNYIRLNFVAVKNGVNFEEIVGQF